MIVFKLNMILIRELMRMSYATVKRSNLPNVYDILSKSDYHVLDLPKLGAYPTRKLRENLNNRERGKEIANV